MADPQFHADLRLQPPSRQISHGQERKRLRFRLISEQWLTRRLTAALILAITLIYGLHATASPLSNLPELGAPADQELSVRQERELGEYILKQIRAQLALIEDPQLNNYIQSLGDRLISSTPAPRIPFTFLIARNRAVNAFATTGGIIVINSGLIEATHNEAELAAVMAHEIAHVTQRHIARTLEARQRMSLPTLLALIGGLAVGTRAPQVGSAISTGAVAGNLQTQLNFSRAYESEADAIGIGILARAGYPPEAMAIFFARLAHAEQASSSEMPELLRTHPVTSERIAEAEARAADYRNIHLHHTLTFALAKARLQALLEPPHQIIDNTARASLAVSNDLPDRYRYALALERAGHPKKAQRILERLVAKTPNSVPLHLALATATRHAGNPKAALEQMRALNALYPQQEPIVVALAKTELANNLPTAALTHLRALIEIRSVQPLTLKLEAEAAAHANRPILSHEALARYYFSLGANSSAIEQLDLALKTPALPPSDEARLRNLKRELQTKALREKME